MRRCWSRRRGPGLLSPGLPAFDACLAEAWGRIAACFWRDRPTADLLGHMDPASHRPLREAVAAHLGAARGFAGTTEDRMAEGVALLRRAMGMARRSG